jgi:hypothetical protein
MIDVSVGEPHYFNMHPDDANIPCRLARLKKPFDIYDQPSNPSLVTDGVFYRRFVLRNEIDNYPIKQRVVVQKTLSDGEEV